MKGKEIKIEICEALEEGNNPTLSMDGFKFKGQCRSCGQHFHARQRTNTCCLNCGKAIRIH
jgi:rRNA maturation endonuclease Nob1